MKTGSRLRQLRSPEPYRQTHRVDQGAYSLAETFDAGRDTGTQVDRAYEGGPFVFNGELDRVWITLTD